MIHAFKSVIAQPFPAITLRSPPVPRYIAGSRLTPLVRLAHNVVPSQAENRGDMDRSTDPKEKNAFVTSDVMEISFGEGYATRSDEEGFGGIYGGNQRMPEVDIDKEIHVDHQGHREVK
ncbi:uncharacterized protein LOC110822384 isoform X2 [Carica papaya]|uniref:uncharacterized protein LOC110822384 isoform X2 n=1 Tax=Carica papaya TaxID=3649 RepID=UPI000B8C85B3|nr:uncharacterized protein LOC110822384 isoform X2 [Carica papaya]